MADRHPKTCEGPLRAKDWRRAWFDGWTEGVIWTLAETVHALREGGHPEAVGLSVIQRVVSEHASPDVEAHAEPLTLGRLIPERNPPHARRHAPRRARHLQPSKTPLPSVSGTHLAPSVRGKRVEWRRDDQGDCHRRGRNRRCSAPRTARSPGRRRSPGLP